MSAPERNPWHDYRKRRRITWLAPGLVLLAVWRADLIAKPLPVILLIAAFALYFALNRWYENWLCPGCGKSYREKHTPHGEPQCSSCGLPKWANPSATIKTL